VNRLLFFLFILIFFQSCSFNSLGGFWSKNESSKKNISEETKRYFEKEVFKEEEFNETLKVSLDIYEINIFNELTNNYGFTKINNNLKKINKYKFSKIKNFKDFSPNLVLESDGLIFFDKKGTITKYDKNSKIVWRSNIYSKDEKKSNPLIKLQKTNKNQIILFDNLSTYYSLDKNTGKIIWKKKHDTSFNSEIKIYNDKIYVVDTNNTINCFSLDKGNKIWSYSTKKPFINSNSNLSVVIEDNIVIFSNSVGEITALDVENGILKWKFSTIFSENFSDILNFEISPLVISDNNLYFSSNKNQFFSLDIKTGTINWKQAITSNLKPIIVDRLIFTISQKGFLYIIEKISGNILKISNILDKTKIDKNPKYLPTGFFMNKNNIFVTTNFGYLYVYSFLNNQIIFDYRFGGTKISRPFIHEGDVFVVKNDSIIRLK
jgi:outer membrane protein assembly factor BamB